MQQQPPPNQTPAPDPDLALVRAMGQGQVWALDEFVGRYQARLTSFAFRYLGDWPAAEDVAQETMLRVWDAAADFAPRALVSTWVFGITYRLALNELKRRGRFAGLIGRLAEMGGPRQPASAPDQLQAWQESRLLAEELAKLPQRQRAALLLRAVEGLGYAQIAQIMGVSVAGVESLIHRARQRLRQRLGRP